MQKEGGNIQSTENNENLIFSDPTYDVAFKMLFGRNDNKDILISFLNSLLGFENENTINSLAISNTYLGQDDDYEIQCAVDIRCETTCNKDISIEMQRENKEYFLSRCQFYMAKMITSHVKEESEYLPNKLRFNYLLVLAKHDLFVGHHTIKGDSDDLYEKTFLPTCNELGNQEMPGNKMIWKFYELAKFKNFSTNKTTDNYFSLKEQWRDFLVSCSQNSAIPENINEIIKKAYNKMIKLTENQRIGSSIKNKVKDVIKQSKNIKQEQEILKTVEKKGKNEEFLREIDNDISFVKSLLKCDIQPKQIYEDLKVLNTNRTFEETLKTILFIKTHIDDSESDIRKIMNLDFLKDLN